MSALGHKQAICGNDMRFTFENASDGPPLTAVGNRVRGDVLS
jgi:hypothetical protein